MMAPLLSTFVTTVALLVSLTQPAASSPMKIVWPRALIRGSTTTMWIESNTSSRNVTVRLADEDRLFEDKTIPIFFPGSTPVELTVPLHYEGQLTLRIDDGSPDELMMPVHPLEPIRSLSLRLEKAVYHANEAVSIWLACLDHHGRVMMTDAFNEIQVAAHDPNNVIVQYWNAPRLMIQQQANNHAAAAVNPGIKNLVFQLSDAPPLGQWTVRATSGGLTASQNFQLVTKEDEQNFGKRTTRNRTDADGNAKETPLLMSAVESHFVELNFSPRTVSSIRPGSPIVGELTAGTSEKGITVGVDVLDHLGSVLHHQTVHLNRTASVIFIIPGLENLTTNATLQGNLQSIDGQPLDNEQQFVLATHPINVAGQQCNVQLFSRDGRYRFKEGETLHLAVFTDCECSGNERINYAITSRSSGHIVSWGQEHSVTMMTSSSHEQGSISNNNNNETASRRPTEFNLSIPITYEMIPNVIITVFFNHNGARDLVSSSLEIVVEHDSSDSMVKVLEMKANNIARLNLTLPAGNYFCLYGHNEEDVQPIEETLSTGGYSIETDRFLRLLPKYPSQPIGLDLFGPHQLWLLRCFEPSDSKWLIVEATIPAQVVRPVLTLLTVSMDGQLHRSSPTPVPIRAAPWTIDFQLPDSVRLGEELVVDVSLSNEMASNCSQTQLQMALTGGATFVANGKKYLQQPACLGSGKSVYRVGIQIGTSGAGHHPVTLTVQLRGYSGSSSCCTAPKSGVMVNLDVHQELMETLPVSKSVPVSSAKDWQRFHSENYLFCLGEYSFVSNISSFDYEILPLLNGKKTIIFQASAAAELRVALMAENNEDVGGHSSYHVILGGEENTNSWISKQMNGLTEIKVKLSTPKLLRPDRLQTFWISWDQQKLVRKKRNKASSKKQILVPGDGHRWLLSVGKGSHIGVRPLISIPMDIGDSPESFRFIGFSTGWGIQGFFRVWGTGKGVDQTIRTLNVMKPAGKSQSIRTEEEKAEITIKGGIASSLDHTWTGIPPSDTSTLTGVLERFYRSRMSQHSNIKADSNWNRVLQNILSFRLVDGSFHDSNGVPDIRLTALAVHAISTVKAPSYSDPALLNSALLWMHGQQNDDGSFSSGETDERNATCFILSCLADIQHDDIVLYQLISAAQRYLERELTYANQVQSIVPMAAALLASRSTSWPLWLAKLDSFYDALFECQDCWNEMTYALAAYIHHNRPEKVLDIVKVLVSAPWEALHPFDRVREMKVWSKYGQMLNDPIRNLHLRLTFQNGDIATAHNETKETVFVNSTSILPDYDDDIDGHNETGTHDSLLEEHQKMRIHTPPLTYEVPGELPQNVELTISGTGCAVVQTKVQWKSFNLVEKYSTESLINVYTKVEVIGEGTEGEPPATLNALLCAQWNGTEAADLRLRVDMFSSYTVTLVTADGSSDVVKHSASNGKVVIDLDQVKSQCARCVMVRAERRGVVRNIRPGRIEIYERKRPQFPQQWLLHGPPDSQWWASEMTDQRTNQLSSRPTTCG